VQRKHHKPPMSPPPKQQRLRSPLPSLDISQCPSSGVRTPLSARSSQEHSQHPQPHTNFSATPPCPLEPRNSYSSFSRLGGLVYGVTSRLRSRTGSGSGSGSGSERLGGGAGEEVTTLAAAASWVGGEMRSRLGSVGGTGVEQQQQQQLEEKEEQQKGGAYHSLGEQGKGRAAGLEEVRICLLRMCVSGYVNIYTCALHAYICVFMFVCVRACERVCAHRKHSHMCACTSVFLRTV